MNTPLATLNLKSARSPQEPLGTIALPVRDHLNTSTVASLLWTDWTFVGSENAMDRLIIQGNILPLQRNAAIQLMRGEFLLFIDDDMAWEPDAIGRLVDSYFELNQEFDEPIMLGALCHRRSEPFAPTLYMRREPTDGPYTFLEKWDTDVVEVDATGMAFVLISKAAIAAFTDGEMPTFEERMQMPGPPPFFKWEGKMGEDLRFCADAKANGVRIFVDTRIAIGHIGEMTFGRKQFLEQIAIRLPEVEEGRREENEAMGLPTMSAAEARAELGW